MRRIALWLALVLTFAIDPAAAQAPLAHPDDLPQSRADLLDYWFDVLADAKTEGEADEADSAIQAIWLQSGNEAVDTTMQRVLRAIDRRNYAVALDLLEGVIADAPTFAEAWNRRATVYYMIGDFRHSIADVEHVLALEPRHFGALAGLGQILHRAGDDYRAWLTLQRAIAIHPFLTGSISLSAELETTLFEDI